MKTFFAFVSLLLLTVGCLHAQVIRIDSTSNWKKSFKAGLNLNQASFSSNWKGGGINSIGFASFLNYKADYKKDKNSWNSELDLGFGMVRNAGQGARKTIDRIFFDTRYGRAINANWDFSAGLNFLSQFAKGYSYTKNDVGVEQSALISDILAPAFITTALGLEYHPVSYFKVRISPFAPRVTIVQDPTRFTQTVGPKPYGVDSTETTRYEWLAFQLVAEFNKDIAKNLNLTWRYLSYANYETIEMKTIDHRLDLSLTAKVNNFVNVSFGTILLYDLDQDSGAQLSQLLNIGFLYTFQNYQDKK